MTKRWFTSDTHHGHRLVAGLRGFWLEEFIDGKPFEPDVDTHNTVLAKNWDRVVGKNDTVFVLGDITMNPKNGAFDWFTERPGIKHLISGNHDSVHPRHTRHLRAQKDWHALGIFESINSHGSIKLAGQKVLMSHFPYAGEGDRKDGGPDRFSEWRFKDEGMPLLHGHTHSAAVHETPYSFHVGLDAHKLQLVPESAVIEWLNTLND